MPAKFPLAAFFALCYFLTPTVAQQPHATGRAVRVPVERPTAIGRLLFGPIVHGYAGSEPVPPSASVRAPAAEPVPLQPLPPSGSSPYRPIGGCNGGGYYQQCIPGGGCTIIPAPSTRWQAIRSTPLRSSPPVQPAPPVQPKIDTDAIVDQVVARVVQRLQTDETLRLHLLGPTGPAGPPGPPGERGEKAVIDYDTLIRQVIADLPPVRLAIRRPDGSIREKAEPLGEPIGIDIREIQ